MVVGVKGPEIRDYVPKPVAATLVVSAADSLHPERADYVCDGVNDHVEIQAALDALLATGGSVILLDGTFHVEASLVMDSYQTLRGQGWNTILITATALSGLITAIGGAGTEKVGIGIYDLQIDADSIAYAGNLWDYVDYSEIKHVWVHGCTFLKGVSEYGGVQLMNSDHNKLLNVQSSDNITRGIALGDWLGGASGCSYNIVSHCICERNGPEGGGNGIGLALGSYNIISENDCSYSSVSSGIELWDSTYNTIVNNHCLINDFNGIAILGDDNLVQGNTCIGNDDTGISNANDRNRILDNDCSGNSNRGIYNAGDSVVFIGNKCHLNDEGMRTSGSNNLIRSNDFIGNTTVNFINTNAGINHVDDNNLGITIDQIKHYRLVKNTSGAVFMVGYVVSLKAVAAGNEVTNPAAIGERQVFGVVAEVTLDNTWGYVQTKGKNTLLMATNAGGGNIAIGDFLITEAGNRARKSAAATDAIFARALEACAVGDADIDAYIMSPWD